MDILEKIINHVNENEEIICNEKGIAPGDTVKWSRRDKHNNDIILTGTVLSLKDMDVCGMLHKQARVKVKGEGTFNVSIHDIKKV